MSTVLLLLISNTFMTFAWYGHLKHRSAPLLTAILVSWLIALGEYCFQVPANRIGYGQFMVYQVAMIDALSGVSIGDRWTVWVGPESEGSFESEAEAIAIAA